MGHSLGVVERVVKVLMGVRRDWKVRSEGERGILELEVDGEKKRWMGKGSGDAGALAQRDEMGKRTQGLNRLICE